jgi:hypothetical protein
MANTVIDHQHIAQPLTGQAPTTAKRPEMFLVAIAVVSFVVCVVSFAMGASLAYRSAEVRRVRQVERDWESALGAGAHNIVN